MKARDLTNITDEQADQIARALGIWRRLDNLSASDLMGVLRILGLKPLMRNGVVESLCPCCDRPGATWARGDLIQ